MVTTPSSPAWMMAMIAGGWNNFSSSPPETSSRPQLYLFLSRRTVLPENKQPKRRRSYSAEAQNKKIKTTTTEPAIVVVMEDGETSDEVPPPPQRRKITSSAQSDAQSGELQNPTADEVQALWGEIDIVEDADSRFPTPVSIYVLKSSDLGPLLPSNTEQPIINTAPSAAASQPSPPTTSCPSTPVIASPPAPTASPPPATGRSREGASPPRSPDHENLGHNYSPPSPDPLGRRSATLSISKECHLLSKLASEKDRKKIRSLSGECLLNNVMHNAAAVPYLLSYHLFSIYLL
ncbi:pollen-specific leucine-rich repeat extensin-like protein 2 [Nicotiana tomentosiformis]|uniref:pollen-specific leucine-rich repeat extensin-like protein 2 n=1 Tax=Nicotiana tomentosiformis TaxID=4098 RepID=UPI00388C5C71